MRWSCSSGLRGRQPHTLHKSVGSSSASCSLRLIRVPSRNCNCARRSSTEVDGYDSSFDKLLPLSGAPQGRGPSSREGGRIRVCVTFCHPAHVLTFAHRWFRHPSYTGFFYWAVGTQMVLQNHVCFIVFTSLLWRFFYFRVRCEYPPAATRTHTECIQNRRGEPVN